MLAIEYAQRGPPPPQSPLSFRAASVLVRSTVSTNEFKNGLTVEIDGVPYKVIGALPACGASSSTHERLAASACDAGPRPSLHRQSVCRLPAAWGKASK
jgi:hypothetical protein